MGLAAHTSPLRILHLEDSLPDHRLTVLALRESGLSVELLRVETLAEFASAIGSKPFDAILADYQLAGFTALDAWQMVADRPTAPPFILLSGAIGEAAAVDAIRLGMADYVLKDHLFRLSHVISRACEMYEARRERELAVRELASSQQSLASLTEHLQNSIEKERASIAREIHDDIGGALTAIRFDLAWIERHAMDQVVVKHAHAATQMLQHALGASQRIMKNLRPPVLDEGLAAALEWLTRDFEQRTSIPVALSSSLCSAQLPRLLQLVAYRTAQEALTNISKHATATAVKIDISDGESVLTLEVSDNGRGMEQGVRDKQQSFGLVGLRERAKTVGGWLDVSSRPSEGTSLILTVPLHQAAANAEAMS